MIRMIATDLDGTLLQNGAELPSERFYEQVRALRRQGVFVLAASGRQYHSLRKMFEPVQDELLYLCENGAVVVIDGAVHYTKCMPRTLAQALTEDILAESDHEVLINCLNTGYLIPKQEHIVHLLRDVKRTQVQVVSSFDDIQEEILKAAAYIPEGATDAWCAEYDRRWGSQCHALKGGVHWVDFGIANKGDGIRKVCELLNLTPDEIVAFGDNFNDGSMLELVGHPWVMSSAHSELTAKYPHCPTVEDKVEELLHSFTEEGR